MVSAPSVTELSSQKDGARLTPVVVHFYTLSESGAATKDGSPQSQLVTSKFLRRDMVDGPHFGIR
jgi:hypothetical protein